MVTHLAPIQALIITMLATAAAGYQGLRACTEQMCSQRVPYRSSAARVQAGDLSSNAGASRRTQRAVSRRRFEATRRVTVGSLAAAMGAGSWPLMARADLASAGTTSSSVMAAPAAAFSQWLNPAGRFEKLTGANAFIGSWELSCTDGPSGTLNLLRDGDVELRSVQGVLLGTGVGPWTYKQPEKGASTVLVSFSVDVSGGDVLYFAGAVDAAAGPERRLEGSLSISPGRKVGDFVATPAR